MNDKKKLIELFLYIAIVIIGVILLITSNGKSNSTDYLNNVTGGMEYAAVFSE